MLTRTKTIGILYVTIHIKMKGLRMFIADGFMLVYNVFIMFSEEKNV